MKKIVIFLSFSLLIVCGGVVWGIYEYKFEHNVPASLIFETLCGQIAKPFSFKTPTPFPTPIEGKSKPTKITSKPSNDVKWRQQLEEAERYYEKGQVCLEKTFRKRYGFKRNCKLAIDYFRKALKIYKQLESIKPNDSSITARINEITQKLVYLRKQRVR